MASSIQYSPITQHKHSAFAVDEKESSVSSHMSSICFAETSPSPVYGNSTNILTEGQNLLRIAMIDKELPAMRSGFLTQLNAIWEKLPQIPSAQDVREAIAAPMRPIFRKFHAIVQSVYSPEFTESCDATQVAAKVEKFRGDSAILRAFPIKPATAGQKGPTFLVRYPLDSTQMQSYGFKWIPLEEACCQHVYSAFSRCFRSKPEEYCGFLVPTISTLNFKSGIHELPDRNQVVISNPDELEQIFGKITQCYNRVPKDPNLMIFERIDGKNLLEFAKNGYSALSPSQKGKLWIHLGRLAMLDIFMGNYDRLAHIAYRNGTQEIPGEYLLDPIQANLGNILIQQGADENVLVYAIDNSIEPELINNQANRREYLTFLQTLLSDPKVYSKIASNILISMQNSVREAVQEADGSGLADAAQAAVEAMQKELSVFSKDLESAEAREPLELGVSQMGRWMKGNFVEAWKRSDLQEYLKATYPGMREALTERFECSELLSRNQT